MSEESYQARTLPQVVAEAAASYGDRIAITDGEVNLSYAELDAARLQAAQAFVASGLIKGDRIAIWAPNIYLFTVGDFLGVSYPELLRDQDLHGLEQVVMLSGEAEGAVAWEAFLAQGDGVSGAEVERRSAELTPEDTLDIRAPLRRTHAGRYPGYPVYLRYHRQAQGGGHQPRAEYSHL
jgi:hypothetical protein